MHKFIIVGLVAEKKMSVMLFINIVEGARIKIFHFFKQKNLKNSMLNKTEIEHRRPHKKSTTKSNARSYHMSILQWRFSIKFFVMLKHMTVVFKCIFCVVVCHISSIHPQYDTFSDVHFFCCFYYRKTFMNNFSTQWTQCLADWNL